MLDPGAGWRKPRFGFGVRYPFLSRHEASRDDPGACCCLLRAGELGAEPAPHRAYPVSPRRKCRRPWGTIVSQPEPCGESDPDPCTAVRPLRAEPARNTGL